MFLFACNKYDIVENAVIITYQFIGILQWVTMIIELQHAFVLEDLNSVCSQSSRWMKTANPEGDRKVNGKKNYILKECKKQKY